MNKAITDGVVFMPTAFADGLHVWSSGDGTPGSDTYENASNAAFVPADQDFSGCLEIQKTSTVTKLRYMTQTPLVPGCYLRISTRVKLVSGAFPNVRIAGWAGAAGDVNLSSVVQVGPETTLTNYGEVIELSAIVGSGNRGGVDLIWGKDALYGYFGLDLTGPSGGIVRIDDFTIEDISAAYADELVGGVDVRDYGAKGDGVTDDHDAFEAADAAANGREVLVPEGVFKINGSITFQNRVRFVGTLDMPDTARLTLLKDFNLPSYIDAFGDEITAFKKAFQSLYNFNDHTDLDMGGRRIELTEPLDMQAAVANKDQFNIRRVIRNGQFDAQDSAAWDTDEVTSVATYDPNSKFELTNVVNAANIQIGSHVDGVGVGREIYVTEVNVAAQKVTISMPLFDAAGTQTYTFKRFKYMLDFSGFQKISALQFDDVDFQCSGHASALMLPLDGLAFHFRDCFFTKPKDRGITSIGTACQGMMFDRCQFLSNESPLKVQDRVSIGFNTNKNDLKIRDCRVVHFKHFGIIGGSGSTITGNHWFHGDSETDGVRQGGLVFTTPNVKALITGNYIDNNYIEWTNEHDESPEFFNQFSFGGMTITGNIFTVNDVASWFKFILIKPYGSGHYINGLSITGNVFRALNGAIERVEGVNTTYADLDRTRARDVLMQGNTFHSVTNPVYSPCTLKHYEPSDAATWTIDYAEKLPFDSHAVTVESLVKNGQIKSGSSNVTEMPYVLTSQGADKNQVKVGWANASRGTVTVIARIDNAN